MTRAESRPSHDTACRSTWLFLSVCLFCLPVTGSDLTGDELARNVYERADGQDAVIAGSMTLQGENSRMRVRRTYTYQLEGENGNNRALIRFTEPGNIAETGLLVHNHADGDSDQWLYLPAAKRVRRISSDNLGGSFVQSDLYFEDLQDRRPEEDTHIYLGTEEMAGSQVHKLESIPVDASSSAYTRRISWIHPQTLVPVRIDFFKGSETPIKRFEVLRIENIQGYWTVMASRMTTLRSGHQTLMQVDAITYDQALPEDLFSIRALSDVFYEREFRE
ncbi:outer membrane lipoprotein-sorting protein [Chromatocurvus halotolerans]|uniref:Outer membrane lipoprotein-sorting protein n=1 Tax=Chromatocurvus halotolerans TaxID=1132028 RepID=A0A4R2KVS6_9GAMM|nr:outer membrane lipoprotein-sorting protein [Chromatocurvus halotolerans]TCO74338.1 outer membrane lipoprotein-sorting protein [Chromatocurvus halotolerans]